MTLQITSKLKKFPKTLLFFMLFLLAAWTLRELALKSVMSDTTLWSDTIVSAVIKCVVWAIPAIIIISKSSKNYQLSLTTKELFASPPKSIWFALAAALGLTAYIVIGNVMRNGSILFKDIIPAGMEAVGNQVAWSTLFSSVIVASITEEIVFRGLCYNMLAKVWGHEDANWVSALLFTLIHVPRWISLGLFSSLMVIPNLCYIFVLGMLFSMVMRKTRSIYPPIALHMLNNVLAEILAVI